MMRLIASLLLLFLLTAPPAHAVVKGSASAHGRFAVRLLGGGYYCSGVVIARNVVVTAGHCARGMSVIAAGRSFRVAGVSRSAVLEDGRRVTVSGDAAILRLAAPLPAEFDVAPIGDGSGETYTIAGYGTTDERWRDPFGALHEATLVANGPGELIDPNRTGPIGASACFGDSGGPVLRGGMLVGIVTRATYPSSRLACGHLTRWEPLTVSEPSVASTDPVDGEAAAGDRPRNSTQQKPVPRTRVRVSAAGVFNLFGVMRAQSNSSAGSR
jgi:hypothetical protein